MAKNNVGMMLSAFCGAVVNIIFTAILVPAIGIQGPHWPVVPAIFQFFYIGRLELRNICHYEFLRNNLLLAI